MHHTSTHTHLDVEARLIVRAWLSEVTLAAHVCAAVMVVEVPELLLVRLGKLCAWLNRLPKTVKKK